MNKNTTTNTTDQAKFDRMVAECRKAQRTHANTRPGDARGNAAAKKIEGLVATAERLGFLPEFVRAVNA